MPSLRSKLLAIILEPKLRPWALFTPVLVLLIALPLLRPIISPGEVTMPERVLLATVRSISEGRGLKLDPEWKGVEGTVALPDGIYAARPPTYAVLLAGPAWALQKVGYSPREHEALFTYVLTLVGAALPVALGASVVYRMGRLFELTRPMRSLLAATCVLAGGWISYATVLNPHAPAAAMLMSACACLLYVAASRRPMHVVWLLVPGGMLAALAGAVDPWALPLVVPLPLVVLAMQLPARDRFIAATLLTLGAIPAIWMHCAWSLIAFNSVLPPASAATLAEVAGVDSSATPVERLADLIGRLWTVLFGQHGVFLHFPLLLVGVFGMFAVMRRHWPSHAKMLAAITFVGTLTIVMLVATRDAGLDGRMFAVQWFVVFAPLLMFWVGAVLRRKLAWPVLASIALLGLIGTAVSILGARQPLPMTPYDGFTAADALSRWRHADATTPTGVRLVARPDPGDVR